MSSQNVETVIIDENSKVVGLLQDVRQLISGGQEVITVNQPSQQTIVDSSIQSYHVNTVPTNLIQTAVNQPVNQAHIVQCLNLNTVSTQTEDAIISYLPANQIHLGAAQDLTKPIGNLQVVSSTQNSGSIVLQNTTINATGIAETLPLHSIGQPQNFSNMVLVQRPTVENTEVHQQPPDLQKPQHHQIVQTQMAPQVEIPKAKPTPTYFCVGTLEEVEERIRKHSEETFSHFVVAKKTKSFGSSVSAIDINSKFRVHWQSRDLTSTEECAVQIPYEGTPFVYIGEKAFMCHLGRNKATKNKDNVNNPEGQAPKKHRSRLTKKQGCPAKIFVKQIAKFPGFSIPNNTEYLRTQMSQKLRKALSTSHGQLVHMINYIGTLPDISEHSNHPIGENTPLREPIDLVIREKIIELSWKYGEGVLPSQIKDSLERFVEDELFKDKAPPSKQRRRFYPSEKDISNYIYKAKLLTKISLHEINIMSNQIKKLKLDFPDLFMFFDLEIDGVNADPSTFSEDIALKYSTATILNENRITFSCQSPDQQRLLKMYGKQAILIEFSREANTPFPLYGLFVPTNVDYQLVYLFMVQSRNMKCLRDGFRSVVEWNPDWKPKFLCVDHMKDFNWKHLTIFEEFLPDCNLYINDDSRQKAWNSWLGNPFNSSSVYGDTNVLYNNLNAIANSYTEETLNKAAQDLEDSEVWKLSEMLREWFSSEWLAEAKRWVVGYRHEEYMNMFHLDDTRLDDLQPIRDEHFNCIKSKKIGDFVREYVTMLMPQFYRNYVEKNILDYRKQCLTPVKSPSPTSLYLLNKPACVSKHLNEQITRTGSVEYTVSQVQPGHFIVQEKKEEGVPYSVSFGDHLNFPSCGCIDWLKYKLPCVHFVAIFHGFQGWETLSELYIGSPLFTLDFTCFDKEFVEQSLFNNIQAPGLAPATLKEKELSSKKIEQEVIVEDTTNLSVNKLLPLVMSPKQVVLPLPVVNKTTIEFLANQVVLVRGGHQTQPQPQPSQPNEQQQEEGVILNTCGNVCQELTNVIKNVDNRDTLQKVKLDLQFVLNDVDLELSKLPTEEQQITGDKRKHELDSVENEPESKKKIPEVESSEPVSVAVEEETSITIAEPQVWLDDPELDIKLYKHHQELILNNHILSMDIVCCVQKILRHQFHDVTGFADPESLEALNPTEIFGSDKKVLQLHRIEGHWATSARIGRNIHIFCCTSSSKAAIIQQVLKLINESGIGDNILFIERPEEDADQHMNNCCLHAVAYCVSFAFDIEARNMVFSEEEMRSHLSECLEDMCFSMFPSKLVK